MLIKNEIFKTLILLIILKDIIIKKLFPDSNKKDIIVNKEKFTKTVKKLFQLKDDLPYKIARILYYTEYKNTDINQYIKYIKLLNPIIEKEINTSLIDPSELLIKPFFTKEYIDKLDLKITYNHEPRFDPIISKNVEFYLEKYFIYVCRNKVLLDKKKYKQSIHPKLTIIIPVYNRAEYIENGLVSIQNQNIKDIQIIYVDDMSKDNSIEVIEKLMKEDNRIVLLKNNKNSGTFYTRFVGLVFSKGDYISFADSDDFFLPDILGNSYNAGVKNNVEIVQWPMLEDNSEGKINKTSEYHTSGVVLHDNNLKYYMFYDHHENYAKIENYYLVDKIYKKDLLLRTMNQFEDDLIIDHLTIHEDNLFLFIIFQNADSYYYIDQYGYYWYRASPTSTTNNIWSVSIKNVNKSLHDIFKNLKFIFNYTPDDEKFKMMCFANFEFFMYLHGHKLKYATVGFGFIKEVLNLYLNCRFYSEKQKETLTNAITVLTKRQVRLTKKE